MKIRGLQERTESLREETKGLGVVVQYFKGQQVLPKELAAIDTDIGVFATKLETAKAHI
jgi:hypothetical protein